MGARYNVLLLFVLERSNREVIKIKGIYTMYCYDAGLSGPPVPRSGSNSWYFHESQYNNT